MILPRRGPYKQVGDDIFLFSQEPRDREAVEIIANERDLKKPDIFERGLLLCKHDGDFGVSDGVISIDRTVPQNGVVLVSGDDGPVTRISSGVEFIEDERADILRRLLHELLGELS